MRIPEGVYAKGGYACKLNRVLYGLKQSARCWFERFDEVLKRRNLANSTADRHSYILDNGHITKHIYLVLYVEDVIIVAHDFDLIKRFKLYMSRQFSMKGMGKAKFFSSIIIERENGMISPNETSCLQSVLKRLNEDGYKHTSASMGPEVNYEQLDLHVCYDKRCRNFIDCLTYSMLCIRPDLFVAFEYTYQISKRKQHRIMTVP